MFWSRILSQPSPDSRVIEPRPHVVEAARRVQLRPRELVVARRAPAGGPPVPPGVVGPLRRHRPGGIRQSHRAAQAVVMVVVAGPSRVLARQQVAEDVPLQVGVAAAVGLGLIERPDPVVVVARDRRPLDPPDLQPVPVVGVLRDEAAGQVGLAQAVVGVVGEGRPRGDAGEVPVVVVAVGRAAGRGEAVVGVIAVVGLAGGAVLGEAVAHLIVAPGPGPIGPRIGGAGQTVEGVVAEGGGARGVGEGGAVAVGVVGVGERLKGRPARALVGDGAQPVVGEVGVGDAGAVGVGQRSAVPGGVVAEGPDAGALGNLRQPVGGVVGEVPAEAALVSRTLRALISPRRRF